MHELSLVTELVEECARRAAGRPVTQVRVRCPAGHDVEEISELFGQVTATGPLHGARLEIQSVPQVLRCPCGFAGEVGEEQCAGHMVACPACGRVHEAPGALELVEVRTGEGETAAPTT